MDITVSSGAFFDEVQDAVMYDKSIPLIYTQEIDNDEETNNDVWQIEKYCVNKNSNYCNLYHFCCNVATEKQLKQFYTNEELLNTQIKKFKDAFVSDHRDLINITSEIDKYTKNNNNNLETLKNAFKEFVKEEKR
ncbi:hypothetical protein QTP88_021377 [Uroleucon formosanum]